MANASLGRIQVIPRKPEEATPWRCAEVSLQAVLVTPATANAFFAWAPCDC